MCMCVCVWSVDVDECVEGRGVNCQHDCLNVPGSFKCTCHDGFELIDETRCQGSHVHSAADETVRQTDGRTDRGGAVAVAEQHRLSVSGQTNIDL